MKYKMYYCLESSAEYLSSKDAKPQSDLQGLLELLQRLLDPDDVISVYEISSTKRVRFRLVPKSELAVSNGVQEIDFELLDPGCALVFQKNFAVKGAWVYPMLASCVEKVLRNDPREFGFSCCSI